MKATPGGPTASRSDQERKPGSRAASGGRSGGCRHWFVASARVGAMRALSDTAPQADLSGSQHLVDEAVKRSIERGVRLVSCAVPGSAREIHESSWQLAIVKIATTKAQRKLFSIAHLKPNLGTLGTRVKAVARHGASRPRKCRGTRLGGRIRARAGGRQRGSIAPMRTCERNFPSRPPPGGRMTPRAGRQEFSRRRSLVGFTQPSHPLNRAGSTSNEATLHDLAPNSAGRRTHTPDRARRWRG